MIALICLILGQNLMAAGVDCEGPYDTSLRGAPTHDLFETMGTLSGKLNNRSGKEPQETLKNDPRKVRGADSPEWLNAVAKLQVKNSDGTYEQCSLTLVSDDKNKDSLIALTAGHCVMQWWESGGGDNRVYDIREHIVVFYTRSGKRIVRKIDNVLAMNIAPADYAIVKLNAALPNSDVQPLVHTDEVYANIRDDDDYKAEFKPFGTAAGWSGDTSKKHGNNGKNLTYDENCWFNGGATYRNDSGCHSYGGASGGAMVATVDRSHSEWTEDQTLGTEHLLQGIIRGGEEGRFERTYFTPWSYYDAPLRKVFEKYAK
jgi:hypothetical protein